jgi:hypothetical protein
LLAHLEDNAIMSTQDIPTCVACEGSPAAGNSPCHVCGQAAQPEPVGPTVMEIIAMADEIEEEGLGQIDLVRRALARWGRPANQPVPVGPDVEELAQLIYEQAMIPAARYCKTEVPAWAERGNSFAQDDARDCARAALARWGRPAIQPIPVAEQLPEAGDCITNPRTGQGQWCWGWMQHEEPPYSGRWRMMRREWLAGEAAAWLPAHALPLPTSQED